MKVWEFLYHLLKELLVLMIRVMIIRIIVEIIFLLIIAYFTPKSIQLKLNLNLLSISIVFIKVAIILALFIKMFICFIPLVWLWLRVMFDVWIHIYNTNLSQISTIAFNLKKGFWGFGVLGFWASRSDHISSCSLNHTQSFNFGPFKLIITIEVWFENYFILNELKLIAV